MRPAEDEVGPLWYDDDAGPMIRPYSITGGRTRPEAGGDIDLITLMIADGAVQQDIADLDDEHLTLLELCQERPLTVADLAAETDLPLGVVRVLLGDLLHSAHLRAVRPVAPASLPDMGLLEDVINRLRAL